MGLPPLRSTVSVALLLAGLVECQVSTHVVVEPGGGVRIRDGGFLDIGGRQAGSIVAHRLPVAFLVE